LPIPKKTEVRQKIAFTKDPEDIDIVREYLMLPENTTVNQVGESCFDYVLRASQ
jgi:hypothetical protein